MKVLLVEDDPVLARGLEVNLKLESYQVSWAADLKSAEQLESKENFGLMLLDLNLPDGHGFQLLKKIRDKGSRLPIIILTAQTHEDSVVEGLQLGANDYVKKPFGNRELIARIKAILREPLMRETQLRFGDLLLLPGQRVVRHQDKIIELNRREFDILLLLTQRAEAIVSRESLLQNLDKEGEIFDRTIDSHISHIRNSFKKANLTSIKISSVYGVGYRLEKT